MKKIVLVILMMFMANAAFADVYVRGYTKSNGTYVAPHTRTAPDGIKTNNRSYRGF